jgi:hypothetical protein
MAAAARTLAHPLTELSTRGDQGCPSPAILPGRALLDPVNCYCYSVLSYWKLFAS